MPGSDIAPAEVRAQLDRILRSSTFVAAPALTRLLHHLVDATLHGAADGLKEYSLGVDVFDRGEAFDPRTDTIVRVQARRLRAKLAVYYRTEGQFDPVLVEIPRGRYAATFTAWSAAVGSAHGCDRPDGAVGAVFGAVPASREAGPFGLPAPLTPLVGRQRELEEISRLLLDPDIRLLTLAGPGGSGKTRLALQAASEMADAFPGGTFMIALGPLSDPTAVATALARLLGLRHTVGRPIADALREFARQTITAPTLLLLDNFEHLLSAVPLIVGLIEAAPALKALVTSRAVLRAYGEQEYPVLPLPVPDPEGTLQHLRENPSVVLFAQRARSANPGFALTAGNASTIAHICRRLDGLPLGIELAAARIKLFPAEAILGRLDKSLDFLTSGPRDVPARQRTLRSTIDWSYELLDEAEQRLFRRLAVFVGGCTLEGAEAVCNPQLDLGVDVMSGMTSLVDKSLVQQVGATEGEARFNMLETLREYAFERLIASGDELPTRRAHSAYCIVLAEEGNPRLSAADREAWLMRCDLEQGNFRASIDWLVAGRHHAWALRLSVALFGFWERREQLDEARQRLELALDAAVDAEPSLARARAIGYAAMIFHFQGDYGSAERLHDQALKLFRALGNRRGEAAELNALAVNHRSKGEYETARAYCEQALAICRDVGDEIAAALSNLGGAMFDEGRLSEARNLFEQARLSFAALDDELGVVWSINHLGDVAHDEADLTEARRLYRESLEGFSRFGDLWGVGRASVDLAQVLAELGQSGESRVLFARALRAFSTLDHKRGIARALEGFARLARRERAFERALVLAGAAAAVREAFSVAARPVEQAEFERSLEPAWQSCDRAAARSSWLAGRRLSVDEAIAYALG